MYPPARKEVTKVDHWMGVGMVAFPRQLWNLVGALLVSRFRRAHPGYEAIPNVMYRNLEGTVLADVTMAGGFGHLQKGHVVSFTDLD